MKPHFPTTGDGHHYTYQPVGKREFVCTKEAHLAEGAGSRDGAEETAEAAGGSVLPGVRPGPARRARERAARLGQRVRRRDGGFAQKLVHVLPPTSLTLRETGNEGLLKDHSHYLLFFTFSRSFFDS